ncbi:MAG: transposase, partial [Clostridia bacterium]|nr:transposase [Clostridia bacterium]
MGLRTIILKLHKPSQAKKLILDKAFVNYNNALAFLLEKAHPHLTEIKEHCRGRGGSFSILSLSKWVDAAMSRELNKFGVQPFKDSLRLEFATLLAGYIKRQETMPDLEYPRVRTGSYSHSIYFCRYDTKRNCCLLFDEVTKRYYAKLYLMNNAHARVRKDVSSAGAGLMHVAKDRRFLERNRKKEAYLVCPLDFGRWQEDMLKEAA